jgi:hypothetical protein
LLFIANLQGYVIDPNASTPSGQHYNAAQVKLKQQLDSSIHSVKEFLVPFIPDP